MSPVWADSRSLAATEEVEISFFSWGYLDVSVGLVNLPTLYIQAGIPHLQCGRFPNSEIPGSTLAEQLPAAFRSHATSFIASWRQDIHHKPLIA